MNINPNQANHADQPWLNLQPIHAPAPRLVGAAAPVAHPVAQPMQHAAQNVAQGLQAMPQWPAVVNPQPALPAVGIPVFQQPQPNLLNLLHAHVNGAPMPAFPLAPGLHHFGPVVPPHLALGQPRAAGQTPDSVFSTQTHAWPTPPSAGLGGLRRPRDLPSDGESPNPNPRRQPRI